MGLAPLHGPKARWVGGRSMCLRSVVDEGVGGVREAASAVRSDPSKEELSPALAVAEPGAVIELAIEGGRSPRSMICPLPRATARSTQFSSSRTLPGHSYCIRAFIAAPETCSSDPGA